MPDHIDILLQLMKEKVISAYRLANDINVSPAAISLILSENRLPSAEMCVRLARYFNMADNYLWDYVSKKMLRDAQGKLDEN